MKGMIYLFVCLLTFGVLYLHQAIADDYSQDFAREAKGLAGMLNGVADQIVKYEKNGNGALYDSHYQVVMLEKLDRVTEKLVRFPTTATYLGGVRPQPIVPTQKGEVIQLSALAIVQNPPVVNGRCLRKVKTLLLPRVRLRR